MPRASKKRATAPSRKDPIRKPGKDPKASHLYTDDNPATTIHGTGFKDRAAAERTLELISKRSLTYQFQTVNTMYHRAKHHPAMKGGGKTASNAGMREAMGVFSTWLDETYPTAKAGLRSDGFKPLLSKGCVERFLGQIEGRVGTGDGGGDNNDGTDARAFAKAYVALPKGKRLGNVLMDDGQPEEADWERRRYDALAELVVEGREKLSQWEDSQLWEEEEEDKGGARKPTTEHLRLIAWAWSPLRESKLLLKS